MGEAMESVLEAVIALRLLARDLRRVGLSNTYIFVPRPFVHCTNDWRCIFSAPSWFRHLIRFLCVFEQVENRTRDFLDFFNVIEKIHIIVFVSDLIRQTASPSFNFIQLVLFLVVPRVADVYFLVSGEAARAAPAISSGEHDKTAVDDLVDPMVSILSGFDNLVGKEVLLVLVHSLFWSVIPARIYPFLSIGILPGAIDLGDDRFRHVIRILHVDPVSNFPQLGVMQYPIR